MRASQRDHLNSFRKYIPNSKCYYVNLGLGGFPFYLKKIDFELIIFDWLFLGTRMARDNFLKMLKKISFLKTKKAVKICLPQDEFTSMDILVDFINIFKIKYVFSVSPSTEWDIIYRGVNFNEVIFYQKLTGYLDEGLINKWSNKKTIKSIDIGYRTISSVYWGRFNLIKSQIASLFLDKTKSLNMKCDIKVGKENFYSGDKWYDFLSKCRYTLGVEGGSRILDWDGKLFKTVNDLSKNKNSTDITCYQDVLSNYKEGEINVIAISPRHLEACLTKTVQILVEGKYNGILRPNIHYIELKKDFSNIDNILSTINDESRRIQIADNAFRDIALSGKYTYKNMVQDIMMKIKFETTETNRKNNNLILYLIHYNLCLVNIIIIFVLSKVRFIKNLKF